MAQSGSHAEFHRWDGPDPVPAGRWHYYGAVDEPAFDFGWSAFGAPYGKFGFRRHGPNLELIGSPVGGDVGTVIGDPLPEVFRPKVVVPIMCRLGTAGFGWVAFDVYPDGTILCVATN